MNLRARRLIENRGHVLEQLEPAVEDAAFDQVERDVGIRVEEAILTGGAGDDREDATRKRSTRPASRSDRHKVRLPIVRRGRETRPFMSCTASTASPSTSSVLSQESGAFKVDENTTFGIAVNAARPGSSGIASAKPDICR